MTRTDKAGWAATILVLVVYAIGNARAFDTANALLCIPVALPAIRRHAYNAAAISLTFGILGLAHLAK